MHLGGPGDVNLRLSGSIRSFVRNALDEGGVRPTDVYSFSRGVVQEGQYPHSFMRQGAEEVMGEMTSITRSLHLSMYHTQKVSLELTVRIGITKW